MAIYRALRDLGIGKKVIASGDLFRSSQLQPEALDYLERAGKIAPANLPPVFAIPRLKPKKAALEKIQVITVGDFLEADNAALAAALKVSEAEVRQVKAEFFAQFATPKPKN